MLLFILDSLGSTELLVIVVVALIIFGPKKLPELSRSLGKSLADFRRTSNEFRRTWEREASLAELENEAQALRATFFEEEGNHTISPTVARSRSTAGGNPPVTNLHGEQAAAQTDPSAPSVQAPSITHFNPESVPGQPEMLESDAPPEPASKRDWL